MSHHRRADVATSTVTPTPTCPSQRVFEAAVRSGDRLELQRLLEGRHGKFNVNLYDDDGQTALHQVCDVSDCLSCQNKPQTPTVTPHRQTTPSHGHVHSRRSAVSATP